MKPMFESNVITGFISHGEKTVIPIVKTCVLHFLYVEYTQLSIKLITIVRASSELYPTVFKSLFLQWKKVI
jgi:hypothetical protein